MSIEVLETNRAMQVKCHDDGRREFVGLHIQLSIYTTDKAELSAPTIELLRRLIEDPDSDWSGVWEREATYDYAPDGDELMRQQIT